MDYTYGRSISAPFFVRDCRSGSVSLGFGASVVTLHAPEFQELVRTLTRAARDIDRASTRVGFRPLESRGPPLTRPQSRMLLRCEHSEPERPRPNPPGASL